MLENGTARTDRYFFYFIHLCFNCEAHFNLQITFEILTRYVPIFIHQVKVKFCVPSKFPAAEISVADPGCGIRCLFDPGIRDG
jgi:hypothetical protein